MRTLLLVDDEPDIRESIADLVRDSMNDVRVLTAEGCDDALDNVRTTTIDAVLTDFRMPKCDGAQLIAALQIERPNLPTAMFTAFADAKFVAGIRARFPGLEVVSKAIDAIALLAIIQHLLGTPKATK